MRKLSLLVVAVLLMVLAVLPVAAQEGTVLDIAAGTEEFSFLALAVQNADPAVAEILSGPGPITVFAPTNQAFRNLASTFEFELEDLLADTSLLTQLLQYHVVNGVLTAGQLAELDGQVVPSALPNTGIGFTVQEDGTLIVNGVVRVIEPFNVSASNGIVHTLNNVIFPGYIRELLNDVSSGAPAAVDEPDAEEEPELDLGDSVLGVAVDAGDFETLFAAAQATDMVDFLSGGPFTVFAPTDEAFDALFESLGLTADEVLAMPELVETVLRYHVVDGELTSDEVIALDGDEVNTVLNSVLISDGDPILIDVVDGEVVLNDGQATVITPDVEASNGVIHVIDGVLLPVEVIDTLVEMGLLDVEAPVEEPVAEEVEEEEVDLGDSIAGVAAGNEDFSILLQVVEATGMTDMLFRGGPFTVFAPTNAAFEALLADLGVDVDTALAMPELLAPTLRYHIVDGVLSSDDVIALDGDELPTVLNSVMISDGEAITIEVVDGVVVLNGGQATVVAPDVEASNGVIHVIDGVLIPAEVLAALGLQ